MKSRILIIEDNFCKFFAAKQVLETQLKMKVNVINTRTAHELFIKASAFNPDVVMCRPSGGVVDLLEKMKKRGTNRRNSEIVLLLAEQFDDCLENQVEDFIDQFNKAGRNFASAA